MPAHPHGAARPSGGVPSPPWPPVGYTPADGGGDTGDTVAGSGRRAIPPSHAPGVGGGAAAPVAKAAASAAPPQTPPPMDDHDGGIRSR